MSTPADDKGPVTPLRWARCPEDGRLHLLRSAGVAVVSTRGHTEALCGIQLGAAALTITSGSAGALCPACLAGIEETPPAESPPPVGRSQWALSPYGWAHLLCDDDPPAGECGHGRLLRKARCGAEVPGIVAVHEQPPGHKCVQCDLLALADDHAPRFTRAKPIDHPTP